MKATPECLTTKLYVALDSVFFVDGVDSGVMKLGAGLFLNPAESTGYFTEVGDGITQVGGWFVARHSFPAAYPNRRAFRTLGAAQRWLAAHVGAEAKRLADDHALSPTTPSRVEARRTALKALNAFAGEWCFLRAGNGLEVVE